jgi:hypothetical protein
MEVSGPDLHQIVRNSQKKSLLVKKKLIGVLETLESFKLKAQVFIITVRNIISFPLFSSDNSFHVTLSVKYFTIITIFQIYSDPIKRLPLQWRPEDIYCKATYGDR